MDNSGHTSMMLVMAHVIDLTHMVKAQKVEIEPDSVHISRFSTDGSIVADLSFRTWLGCALWCQVFKAGMTVKLDGFGRLLLSSTIYETVGKDGHYIIKVSHLTSPFTTD